MTVFFAMDLFRGLLDPVEMVIDAEQLLFGDCSSYYTYPAAGTEKNGIFQIIYPCYLEFRIDPCG